MSEAWKEKRPRTLSAAMIPVCLLALLAAPAFAADVGFVGLHGGVYQTLQPHAAAAGVRVEYVADAAFDAPDLDLSGFRVIIIQHLRSDAAAAYRRAFQAARQRNPALEIFTIEEGGARGLLPDLVQAGVIGHDPGIPPYYGNTSENLRRLVGYLAVTHLGRLGTVEPPEAVPEKGLFHPDHDGLFPDVATYLAWLRGRGGASRPRVVVTAHFTHLMLQQPKVVVALVRALEQRGLEAVAIVDGDAEYEGWMLALAPKVVIHTCHSRESVAFREKLGVPHLHALFFRHQSIDQWKDSLAGLAPSELAFQVTSQDLLGATEYLLGSGTERGGGSDEAFTPIPERIDHIADRARSWVRLASVPEKDKKVAVVYYDRELGKAELMRGSATGMFMNAPRSLVKVLHRMQADGYRLTRVPGDDAELLGWMKDHGRQIGVWAPGVLDTLARSGQAVLVPEAIYKQWFETRLTPELQQAVVARWGPPPGKFLVFEDQGKRSIVIPRVDLGNVILLPQPLRGEAHDTTLLHDTRVPPPHNYIATYLWLQLGFQGDALVHFGTHGSEFLLPGRPTGLGADDWPDVLMGALPNLNLWVINNLGESDPVRRRAYAVLIDHLVPPSVRAELADELLNLHDDIEKWDRLEPGALRSKLQAGITQAVLEQHLDRDLRLEGLAGRVLTDEEVGVLSAHLHRIQEETTPTRLHILGEPPATDDLIPWLVVCLGRAFTEALAQAMPGPTQEAGGDREAFLRQKAEGLMSIMVRQNLSPAEALAALRVQAPKDALLKFFEKAAALRDGFARTGEELDQVMAALDGRYLSPGPGGAPDRNPAVLPTGRNMYVMNPEAVPARAAWELGVELVDQLLAGYQKAHGRLPQRVAFTLNSFATFQDYGVMESQILYLMGVRPVWDDRNLVTDIEVIPRAELDRPRVDVFISALSYYRDMLPTRMTLIDRAIRRVSALDEPDNPIAANSRRVAGELKAGGMASEDAELMSHGRIFGYPPGQQGSAGYYYLIERSGQWTDRADLMDAYLAQVRYVYTEGRWGVSAPQAYDRQIQGTDVLLRSWSDRTRSPLSNKYDWYHGGSLSMAVKHLTGKEPEWYFSDVRDADKAQMVNAEDALRTEYRVRLFNRKWIEGMMQEGYAGADQVAVHVSNTFGWATMRPGSVSADVYEEIVDTYFRDQKNLHIREWFEAHNPHAFQEVAEILLETVRKGYWKPDEATLREITEAYARSVARHGESGGLRGGGNTGLEALVDQVLDRAGLAELKAEVAVKRAEQVAPASATAPVSANSPEARPPTEAPPEIVTGTVIEHQAPVWPWFLGGAVVLLFVLGLWRRVGAAR